MTADDDCKSEPYDIQLSDPINSKFYATLWIFSIVVVDGANYFSQQNGASLTGYFQLWFICFQGHHAAHFKRSEKVRPSTPCLKKRPNAVLVHCLNSNSCLISSIFLTHDSYSCCCMTDSL